MNRPQRKQIRLLNFDYNEPGAYFITICTYNRQKILSHIVGAIHESPDVKLTEQGKIVDNAIKTIPEHLNVQIDKYIIMPNHIHMIITVKENVEERAIRESPLQGRSIIAKTVGYIKMNSSKAIHQQLGAVNIWQRSFYDHVIRNKADYNEIYTYIETNPQTWQTDIICTIKKEVEFRLPFCMFICRGR